MQSISKTEKVQLWKEMWYEDRWERKCNAIPPVTWKRFKASMEAMDKRQITSS